MAFLKDYLYLANFCFASCGILENAMRGKSSGSLSKPEKAAIEDLQWCVKQPWPLAVPNGSRAMHEIEKALRRWASTPWLIGYNKEKFGSQMSEVQRLLDILSPPRSPEENFGRAAGSPILSVVLGEIYSRNCWKETARCLSAEDAQGWADQIDKASSGCIRHRVSAD
jgi:hypothetical protein